MRATCDVRETRRLRAPDSVACYDPRMILSRPRFALPCLLLLLATACSSTSTTPSGGTDDAGTDAAPSLGCGAGTVSETAVEIDPSGPDGQIHAYAVPTGDGFFVVYNRPAEGSTSQSFAVYATKLGCDGKVLVPPVRVSEGDDNQIDPSAAWNGKNLVVVWSADTGKSPVNLELRTRVLDAAGKPLSAVRTASLVRKGKPNVGNAWMPEVVSGADGTWLVGAWGHDEAPAFQAFVQKLDPQGALAGEAEDAALAPTTTQSSPAVAVDAQKRTILAWAEEPNQGNDPPATWVREGTSAPRKLVTGGGAPSLATGASGTWLAAKGAVHLLGTEAHATLPTTYAQPAVAADETGALVVAYTAAQSRAPIRAVRVSSSGALGTEIDLGIASAAAYPLHLARVSDGVFLFAYQEGAGTKLRAKARFLEAK
jgi:hypothetical protein